MQFILFTNPKRVYIVGIDCTSAAGGTHFIGVARKCRDRGEDVQGLDKKHHDDWIKLKTFVETYYPNTEIISVNPVGLKGLFRDVYTDSFAK